MICVPCRGGDHQVCIEINVGKCPPACDCQHRVEQKTVLMPAQAPNPEVLLPQVG